LFWTVDYIKKVYYLSVEISNYLFPSNHAYKGRVLLLENEVRISYSDHVKRKMKARKISFGKRR